MSILIKGMKMPTEGAVIAIYKLNDKFYASIHGTELCPLISVPPHGDLIERKAAHDSLLTGMVMTGYQSRALDCINEFYVPTIIEAEDK